MKVKTTDDLLRQFQESTYWLHNVLFNELYQEHPELWPWIQEKLKEYNKRFKQ